LSSEDIVPFLRELGLNLYESEAYFALVSKGQISAKELGQLTSIPQSRTYDVLSSLKDKGFALITPSFDKVYAPVDPKTILSMLYGKKKKEIQAEMIRVQEETEQRLEKLYGVYCQAKDQLVSVSNNHTQLPNQPVFLLEGNQSMERAMLDLIDKAQTQFLRITKPPDSRRNMLDPFYFLAGTMLDHLDRAQNRGVKIRTLSLTYEIPSLLGLDYEDEENNERKYLEKEEDIPEKFILVDGHSALLNLRDPISKTFGSVGVMLESGPTCSILGEHFESMWKKAEPLSSVSKRMREAVEDALVAMKEAKFERLEISIYRALSKGGSRSTELLAKSLGRHHSTAEISLSIQRLLKRGILIRNDWLKAVMAENPVKVRSIIGKSSKESQLEVAVT
jgi:sugar-specific transcriptional regulator TrmB